MATVEAHVPAVATSGRRSGIWDWITTIDHKKIGILYGVTALFFLLVGGLEALVIRIQLAQPGMHVVSPDFYNELFTMHGLTMIFLVGMPIAVPPSEFDAWAQRMKAGQDTAALSAPQDSLALRGKKKF
ncbi:MAG: cbb3-type cytochrome c oxidase subunit I, partial [Gemmatimonadota bacterium]